MSKVRSSLRKGRQIIVQYPDAQNDEHEDAMECFEEMLTGACAGRSANETFSQVETLGDGRYLYQVDRVVSRERLNHLRTAAEEIGACLTVIANV